MIASDIKMTIRDGTCIGLNQNPNKIHATNALLQRNNLKNTTSIESDFFVIFIQTSSLSLQLYC